MENKTVEGLWAESRNNALPHQNNTYSDLNSLLERTDATTLNLPIFSEAL